MGEWNRLEVVCCLLWQWRLLFFFECTDGHARRVDGYLAQVLQRRRNPSHLDAFREVS
jgi:hypothetical protein